MKLSHTTKPTKNKAFELVKSLKAGNALTEHEIDSLINYFAPAAPKKAKSVEQWVAKACNAKDVREWVHFVHIKDGVATASDGHRVHWGLTELADGTYEPKTMAKVDDVVVPNFAAVKALMEGPGVEVESLPVSIGPTRIKYHQVSEDRGINNQYLMDATNGRANVFVEFQTDKVVGKSEFGNFVVMGMRI